MCKGEGLNSSQTTVCLTRFAICTVVSGTSRVLCYALQSDCFEFYPAWKLPYFECLQVENRIDKRFNVHELVVHYCGAKAFWCEEVNYWAPYSNDGMLGSVHLKRGMVIGTIIECWFTRVSGETRIHSGRMGSDWCLCPWITYWCTRFA